MCAMFLNCVIGCADHCVCCCASYMLQYLVGRVVVGSAFYVIFMGAMLLIYS
jgi:hypothetical protein